MKKYIIAAVALQLIALLAIASKREWIYQRGETVYLRTAPVDPRDIFRGDYVELSYEIATPDKNLIPPIADASTYQTLYIGLQKDRQDVATANQISLTPPDGLYIKAALGDRPYFYNERSFRFGIEKYFVEQGYGLALEQQRGRGQEWQTAMEMEIALGGDGTPVIRGHRWSDFGVRMEVIENGRNRWGAGNRNQNSNERRSAHLRFSLRNQSDKTRQLLDSADHCALQLVENVYSSESRAFARSGLELPNRRCDQTTEWRLITLAPNAAYAIDIDLAEPLWHSLREGKVTELGDADNPGNSYRIVYAPPEDVQQRFAAHNDLWLSVTSSARFFASGRID